MAAMNMTNMSALEAFRASQRLPVVAADESTNASTLWGLGSTRWNAPTDENDGQPLCLSAALRTLVAASLDVRTRLQRRADEQANENRELARQEIVRASREYRDALKTCVFELEDGLGDTEEETDNADEELIDLLKVSLAIWHLCEVLFLQGRARDDKWLAYDLAQWLQEHYGSAQMEALDQATQHLRTLGDDVAVEQDPQFWPTIYGLCMMGCGNQAAGLLALHSSHRAVFTTESRVGASMRESLQAIQRLLLCMPGNGAQAQAIEWQNWHDACLYLQNTDGFVRNDTNVQTLLHILTADPETLGAHASTWYELMLARLQIEEPKATAHRAEFLMANCYKTYNPSSVTMNNFDCIIMAILQYDVQSAMHDIHALGFHWMTVHLSDLLAKSNVLAIDEQVPQYDCSLKEFFTLEYAIALTACSGMWQVSLNYIQGCSRYGSKLVRLALAHEPVTSSIKAQRLWNYCQGKRNLARTQRDIAVRWALVCKQRHDYASALHWSLRANELDQCDTICDDILIECQRDNSLTALNEAVEFLECKLDLARTKKLRWLIQYRELHLVLDDRRSLEQLMREDRDPEGMEKYRFVSKEAAKRVHTLLEGSTAPRCLWNELLQVVETLLQETPTVFTSQQLFGFMASLRAMSRSFHRSEDDDNVVEPQLKMKIEALLARNLTEAFLVESGRGGNANPRNRDHSLSLPYRSLLTEAEPRALPAPLELLSASAMEQ